MRLPPWAFVWSLAFVTPLACSDAADGPVETVGSTAGDTGTGAPPQTGGGSDGGTGAGGDESGGDGGDSSGPETTDGDDAGGTDRPAPLDLPTGEPGCGAPCDPWDAASCGPDDKCTLVACDVDAQRHDAFACRPVLGQQAPGEPCVREDLDGTDDCGAGSVCWEVSSETGQGYCVDFCGGTTAEPTCAEETACTVWGSNALEMALCIPSCDPLVIACPLETQVCVPRPGGDGFSCAAGVDTGTGGGFGEPCEFANACGPGLVCAEGSAVPGCEAQSCCTHYCSLGTEGDCPGESAGQVCVPYFEAESAPVGFAELGVCVLPDELPESP